MSRCRFLGAAIAQYISELIESGEEKPEILDSFFTYDRWREKVAKTSHKKILKKDEITRLICCLVRDVIKGFLTAIDLDEMFQAKRRQFFQLKRFLEIVGNGVCEGEFSRDLVDKITPVLKK